MRKQYLVIFALFSGMLLHAQHNHFNFTVGIGPGLILNDASLNRGLNNARLIGFNYVLTNKKQRIHFNPGISYQGNHYHARIEKGNIVQVNQTIFDLTLDMLMKITSHKYIRIGLIFRRLDYSDVTIAETDLLGKTILNNNTTDLRRDYQSSLYQAGISAGICFPFNMFNREQRFNLKLMQAATPVVDADYRLSAVIAGRDVKVLSAKARPTMLIASLEFNLYKLIKRRKKERPEED